MCTNKPVHVKTFRCSDESSNHEQRGMTHMWTSGDTQRYDPPTETKRRELPIREDVVTHVLKPPIHTLSHTLMSEAVRPICSDKALLMLSLHTYRSQTDGTAGGSASLTTDPCGRPSLPPQPQMFVGGNVRWNVAVRKILLLLQEQHNLWKCIHRVRTEG